MDEWRRDRRPRLRICRDRLPRRRERRFASIDLVALARASLAAGRPVEAFIATVETRLRQTVPLRALRLEPFARCRTVEAGVRDGTLSIPVLTPSSPPATLTALLEPGVTVDDWTRQLFETTATLAGMFLAVEHASRRVDVPGRSHACHPPMASPLIGTGRALESVRRAIDRFAPTNFTLLIVGETGTGKELVARMLHERSGRAKGPFVALNCGALVETLAEAELFGIDDGTATGVRGRKGKFELAQGGTLFLDEVAELSKATQAKLLRVLQDFTIEHVGGSQTRRVDARVIAATNQPLDVLVARRRFREDLLFRLSGLEIHVPPLRARGADILDLARHFLNRYGHGQSWILSGAVEDALTAYTWPGNVRELERVIQYVVTLADPPRIELADLPTAVTTKHAASPLRSAIGAETLARVVARHVESVLARHHGNKARACRELGIGPSTLSRYLRGSTRFHLHAVARKAA